MNGRRIVLPNEVDNPFPGPLDLNAPVTRGELSKILDSLVKEVADLSMRVRVHRVRFEAMLKMITHDPDRAFVIEDGHVHFQIAAFYDYVTEYASEFSQAHNAIIAGRVTIEERVAAAREWNETHPKMPITAEELKLQELVETMRRRITDTEEALPLSLPHSSYYVVGWKEAVANNREIHPE